MLKSSTSDVCSHKYTKIKIHSDDLPLEKTSNTQNAVILIKFVPNKNHIHYINNEKCI